MMRFLTIGLVSLSLLVGVFAPTTNAQQSTCSAGQTWNEDIGVCITPPAPADANGGNTPAGGQNQGSDTALGYSAGAEFNGLMGRIMSMFAWLVGIAALVLDAAVYYTVLTMGNYINELSAIGVTWSILRDIGNIFLIFGFLAVGINMILETHWYGATTKFIPTLLIVAVSLNFSLFVAEAVIDTGNLFASQFYQQINGGKPAGDRPYILSEVAPDEGIAAIILGKLSLQSLYGQAIGNKDVFDDETPMFVALMGILLFMITAFVMLSLAFILVARFVILLVVIITSPIGFAGYAIPPLRAKASQWWHTLISQTLTAPVLMLMLYVVLKVITDEGFLGGFCSSPAGANDGGCGGYIGWIGNGAQQADLAGTASMLLSFLVAMGLLLLVNVVAKELSSFGASWATGMAGKVAFGLPALGARRTVGGLSRFGGQWMRRTKFGQTGIGRFVTEQTFDRGAKASFDLRGAGVLDTLGNVGAGKAGGEGGYEKEREKNIKAHKAYAKSIDEAIEERGEIGDDAITLKEKRDEFQKSRERFASAQTFHSNIKQESETLAAKLKELKEQAAHNQIFDPALAETIAKTEKDKNAADARLAAGDQYLKEEEAQFKAKEKEYKDKYETIEKIVKTRRAEGMGNYAESIKWSPIAGPGAGVAAKKILKEAKKSEDEKMMDTVKEIMKKASHAGEHEEPKKGGEKHETPSSKPSAPASGGHDDHH